MSTIFLAGAGSVIGRRLCSMLLADGWRVFGTTRPPEKAAMSRPLGVASVASAKAASELRWRPDFRLSDPRSAYFGCGVRRR